MTIKLYIFTHAFGIRENIEFDGHSMKYISIINRKWQLSSIYMLSEQPYFNDGLAWDGIIYTRLSP